MRRSIPVLSWLKKCCLTIRRAYRRAAVASFLSARRVFRPCALRSALSCHASRVSAHRYRAPHARLVPSRRTVAANHHARGTPPPAWAGHVADLGLVLGVVGAITLVLEPVSTL